MLLMNRETGMTWSLCFYKAVFDYKAAPQTTIYTTSTHRQSTSLSFGNSQSYTNLFTHSTLLF